MASKSVIDFQLWDNEMASKNADYENLYQQMLKASQQSEANIDIWWRLAQATFMTALNFTHEGCGPCDHGEVNVKTREAWMLAEKATQMEANHFMANLWLAYAAGKVALIESDLQKKIVAIDAFLRSLAVCTHQKPQNAHVLLLEGRLHVALSIFSPEQKTAIKERILDLPEANLEVAESKLRAAMELIPDHIDVHLSLARVLILVSKFAEAKQTIDQGLNVQCVTKSDQFAAKDLEKLKEWLAKGGY